MNIYIRTFSAIAVAAAFMGCGNNSAEQNTANSKEASPAPSFSIERIASMPGIEKGYEKGVSAMYAATADSMLYIAGGCNFPNTPASEGGSKVYYKGICRTTLHAPGKWEKVAELPEESAYGTNIQNGSKWIIAGGMNSKGAMREVYCIDLSTMHIDTLPPLPHSIDNASGTISGNTIYIAGGNVNGKASNKAFSLDIKNGTAWNELPEMPSQPRVQPVCAATEEHVYVWGGFSPTANGNEAIVHTDGLKYSISTGKWQHAGTIIANGDTITLSGGTAIADGHAIVAAGGVDRKIFLDAISGRYSLVSKEQYMHKPSQWYRFNNRFMLYDTDSSKWHVTGTSEHFSRAGALLIKHGNGFYYIGGELKPGIRDNSIYRIPARQKQ